MKKTYTILTHYCCLFIVSCLFLLNACGEPTSPPDLFLSGTVTGEALDQNPGSPVMAIVMRSEAAENLEALSLEAISAYVGIDSIRRTFRIDLTGSGLAAGDSIFVAAFINRQPAGRPPYPDQGDIIGFYMNPQTLSAEYILEGGENSGITININRPVYAYSAAVSGNVATQDVGNLMIAAYKGVLTSDLTALDPNGIIGYTRLQLAGPSSYQLPILPYGFDIPIENVYILAFLDIDLDGQIGPGDKIGYHTDDPRMLPSPVTVDAGETPDIDILILRQL